LHELELKIRSLVFNRSWKLGKSSESLGEFLDSLPTFGLSESYVRNYDFC